MYVFAYMYECMLVCTYMCMCTKTREQTHVFFLAAIHLVICFLRQGLFISLELAHLSRLAGIYSIPPP